METDTTIKPFLKNNPVLILNEKDFNEFILKFGSLLILLKNKNINPTFLFITLIKNNNMQKVFQKMSGMNNLVEMLKSVLITYPNLTKSKVLRDNSIKILKKQKNDKKHVNHRKSKKTL